MAWRDQTAGIASENPVLMSFDSTAMKRVLSTTAVLDFPSTGAVSTSDLTVTLTNAAVGDAVYIGLPSAPSAGFVFFGFVSAANTVTVRAMNITAGALDPVSATYRVTVVQF